MIINGKSVIRNDDMYWYYTVPVKTMADKRIKELEEEIKKYERIKELEEELRLIRGELN